MTRALLCLAAVLATGCSPNISLRTPRPPSATLSYDALAQHVELTEGVAAGFQVWCAWGPCTRLRLTSDAPAMVQIHAAHLAALRQEWMVEIPPGLVLVGVAQGQTVVHVADGDHVLDVTVTVRPAGGAAAPGAAAAPVRAR